MNKTYRCRIVIHCPLEGVFSHMQPEDGKEYEALCVYPRIQRIPFYLIEIAGQKYPLVVRAGECEEIQGS